MTRRERFTCHCGTTTDRPVAIRGRRLCSECAFDLDPGARIGEDMSRWNGRDFIKPPVQIRRIG